MFKIFRQCSLSVGNRKQTICCVKVRCFVDPSTHPDLFHSIITSPDFLLYFHHNYYGRWRTFKHKNIIFKQLPKNIRLIVCQQYVWDNAQRGVPYQELMDDVPGKIHLTHSHDNGHLEGHYPLSFSLYFHAFFIQVKFFISHNYNNITMSSVDAA